MINRTVFTDVFLMTILITFQIFVLNRIQLFGEYIPVLYPVFVLYYPFFRNPFLYIGLSFLIGLSIDALLGTWGINAFATTLLAYFRTIIFRTTTQSTTDFFSFQSLNWQQFLLYIFISIFIHQLIVQLIEDFNYSRIIKNLWNVLVSSVFSFIIIIIYTLSFNIKNRI